MATEKHAQNDSAPESPEESTDALSGLESPAEVSADLLTEPRIKAFVDKGHEMHLEKPRKWFAVKLPKAERRKVLSQAKQYAREKGLSFRVRNHADENLLVYRITKRPAENET